LAVGYWEDQEEIQNQWQIDRKFTPSMAPERVEELRTGWNKALERSKAWIDPEDAAAEAREVASDAASS
jgi:glycerol kinase